MKTKSTRNGAEGAYSDVIELVPSMLHLKTILVPVDFSGHSRKALRYAAAFAEQFGARLTLLNISEPRMYAPEFAAVPLVMERDAELATRRKQLKALARESIEPRLLEKTLVRSGTPFHEITEAARTLRADLIILATHGYTGVKRVLLGSTAERVVRHAPCPVLVVREKEHGFA